MTVMYLCILYLGLPIARCNWNIFKFGAKSIISEKSYFDLNGRIIFMVAGKCGILPRTSFFLPSMPAHNNIKLLVVYIGGGGPPHMYTFFKLRNSEKS